MSSMIFEKIAEHNENFQKRKKALKCSKMLTSDFYKNVEETKQCKS